MIKYSDYAFGVSGDSDTWTAKAEPDSDGAANGFGWEPGFPNDMLGFAQAAIKDGKRVPNGANETADNSQIYKSISERIHPYNLQFNPKLTSNRNPSTVSFLPVSTQWVDIADGWQARNATGGTVYISRTSTGFRLSGSAGSGGGDLGIRSTVSHWGHAGLNLGRTGNATIGIKVQTISAEPSDVDVSVTSVALNQTGLTGVAISAMDGELSADVLDQTTMSYLQVGYTTLGGGEDIPVGAEFKLSPAAAGVWTLRLNGTGLFHGLLNENTMPDDLTGDYIADSNYAAITWPDDLTTNQTVELIGHVGTGVAQADPNFVYKTRIYVRWPERLTWTPVVGEVTVNSLNGGSTNTDAAVAEQGWVSIGQILVNTVTRDGAMLYIDACEIDTGVNWPTSIVQSYLSAGTITINKS